MDSSQRLVWPDAIKGFCILLVVVLHLNSKNYLALGWEVPRLIEVGWVGFSHFLAPIRMPVFFAISGFFISKHLKRPWPDVWPRRVISPYYLYVLWFLIHLMLFLLDPPLATAKPERIGQVLLGLVFGFTSLWYLYALPVYFIMAKMLSRWRVVALIGAGVLSILSGFTSLPGNGESVLRNLFFFLMAAYLPRQIAAWANEANRKHLKWQIPGFILISSIESGASFYGVTNGTHSAPLTFLMGLVSLSLGVLGVAVGVSIFAWAAVALPKLTTACAQLGKKTLPVYLLHLPILACLNILLLETTPPMWVVIVYPFAALPAVVLACLAVHRILLLVRADWLFTIPKQLLSESPQVLLRSI